ncbi:TPA: hypothetical protein ACF3I9_004435 [Klebsiella aerogenes]
MEALISGGFMMVMVCVIILMAITVVVLVFASKLINSKWWIDNILDRRAQRFGESMIAKGKAYRAENGDILFRGAGKDIPLWVNKTDKK